MDDHRFDDLTRRLEMALSRRTGLGAVLGVLLGAAGLDAAAKSKETGKPGSEGPCGDGSTKANRCKKDANCCTKYCAKGGCRCKPNYMKCTKGAHCCSRVCTGGRCDGGAKPEGSACTESFNCKNGLACIKGVCTKSNTATCTKQNCPGCCDGTTCRPGGTKQGCGKDGKKCAACTGSKTCKNGTCSSSCSAATCPDGCCKNGVCNPGTSNDVCGTGGKTCVVCSSGNVCFNGACPGWSNQTTFGTTGSGDSNLYAPSGLHLSVDGLTTWIADTLNNRVVIWSRPDATSDDWTFLAKFGTGNGAGDTQFSGPSDVWVSVDGLTAWVADTFNSRIVIWSRPDAASTTWSYLAKFGTSGSGDSNLSNPTGVWVSGDGLTTWIADFLNNRIAIWSRPDAASTSWSYLTQFGTSGSGNSNLSSPRSVWVSGDGLTAWIADNGNKRIVIWSRPNAASTSWSYQTQFGSAGFGNDNFSQPVSLWVSTDLLTVWVADDQNSRILSWSRPSTTSTAWSYLTQFGTAGTGPSEFSHPNGVVISSDGLTAVVSDSSIDINRISVWVLS